MLGGTGSLRWRGTRRWRFAVAICTDAAIELEHECISEVPSSDGDQWKDTPPPCPRPLPS